MSKYKWLYLSTNIEVYLLTRQDLQEKSFCLWWIFFFENRDVEVQSGPGAQSVVGPQHEVHKIKEEDPLERKHFCYWEVRLHSRLSAAVKNAVHWSWNLQTCVMLETHLSANGASVSMWWEKAAALIKAEVKHVRHTHRWQSSEQLREKAADVDWLITLLLLKWQREDEGWRWSDCPYCRVRNDRGLQLCWRNNRNGQIVLESSSALPGVY